MNIFQKIKQETIFFVARRLPTCKELAPWMSESLEHKLPLRRRVILRIHYLYCVWCLRYLKQLRLMRKAAHYHSSPDEDKPAAPETTLSPEARERLKRALSGKNE
ncbi:MAG TPA: hypothetical protein VNN73_19060 [Blastocatellia bacterium]|nr:hypothetical protein [Blastocatellia bacterium]